MARRHTTDDAVAAVRVATVTAIVAAVVGTVFAAVSIYWGLGGSWLLDTVGGSLEAAGRAGSAGIVLVVWLSVVLKLVAAVLPLATVRNWGPQWMHRPLLVLTWMSGVILTAYGGLLTAVGLLVQTGVIATDSSANHRALAWHAFLWDPWFLLWGLLTLVSLLAGRKARRLTSA